VVQKIIFRDATLGAKRFKLGAVGMTDTQSWRDTVELVVRLQELLFNIGREFLNAVGDDQQFSQVTASYLLILAETSPTYQTVTNTRCGRSTRRTARSRGTRSSCVHHRIYKLHTLDVGDCNIGLRSWGDQERDSAAGLCKCHGSCEGRSSSTQSLDKSIDGEVCRHGRNVIEFTNAVGKGLNTTFETGYTTPSKECS
jgi:hypothetical protein